MRWIKTDFGEMADLKLPKDATAIIICVITPGGLVPKQLSLPHQMYKEKIARLKKEYGHDYRGIVVIPIRSNEYIKIEA
jgi:hypothetical protein